jgi:hypothetical protein
MSLNRKLGFAAAALLLAGAGGAGLAHPHPDGDGDGGKVTKFVIIEDGHDGAHRAEGRGERVQRFKIVRQSEDAGHRAGDERVRHFEMHGAGGLASCDGGEKIVDESAGDGNKTTKIVICRKGAPSAAEAKHLEDALARIRTNDDLSDEQKAKIETALRSAIDRARSTR